MYGVRVGIHEMPSKVLLILRLHEIGLQHSLNKLVGCSPQRLRNAADVGQTRNIRGVPALDCSPSLIENGYPMVLIVEEIKVRSGIKKHVTILDIVAGFHLRMRLESAMRKGRRQLYLHIPGIHGRWGKIGRSWLWQFHLEQTGLGPHDQ
jgi:hypothetical protein